MGQSLFSIFDKLSKGDEGENEVLVSISKLLRRNSGEENYFLIPKAKIADGTAVREIDLLLLHPVLGIFVIEVKNWASMESIDAKNSPFEQVNQYKNLLLAQISDLLGKVPINIEYRVVFPSISQNEGDEYFKNNPSVGVFKNHTLFQEDLKSSEAFSPFFKATTSLLPNKKEFMAIAALVVDKKLLAKQEGKILPVITKDEIVYFDHKQLSILNGYTGEFHIIRGVAGTGKTVVLTHFVSNKIERDPSEKFLILCFNTRLAKTIQEHFDPAIRKNVAVYSLFKLLDRIGFDEHDAIKDFNEKMIYLKSSEATQLFAEKFAEHLKTHPIDYFLCDETQDMPPNLMRVIYEQIHDCIFFIDEAQKFFPYSMETIAEVFHHPEFEKKSMQGRVRNLKNVYRTPSNIAKCAFSILQNDKSINEYYKKSYYLSEGFLSDINFVLEEGRIDVEDHSTIEKLESYIMGFKVHDEVVILVPYKNMVELIQKLIDTHQKNSCISVMTYQSIKGLEAKTVILYDFAAYLNSALKYGTTNIYRQVYVLLTRAQERAIIFLDENTVLSDPRAVTIAQTVRSHQSPAMMLETPVDEGEGYSMVKLIHKAKDLKEKAEPVIVVGELVGFVLGLFA